MLVLSPLFLFVLAVSPFSAAVHLPSLAVTKAPPPKGQTAPTTAQTPATGAAAGVIGGVFLAPEQATLSHDTEMVELLAGVALALQRAEAHAAARAEGGARARAPAPDDDDFVDVSPAEPQSAGDTSSHSGKKRGLFKGHPPSANAKRVCIAPAVAPSPFFDAPPAPPKSSTIGGSLAIEQQAVAALLHAAIANAEDEEMYNELLSHAEKLNNHIMDASALRIALTKARRAARESIGITGSDVKAARQVSHVTPFDRMFSGPKPASRAAHLEYMQVTDTMFLELVRTAEETPAGKHRDTSNIGRPHLLSTRQMIALALHYSTTTASRSDTSVAFDIFYGLLRQNVDQGAVSTTGCFASTP